VNVRAAGCSLVLSAIAVPMFSSACTVESSWSTCRSGRMCPPGLECDDVNDACSIATDPCFKHAEGSHCGLEGTGICRLGVCISRCGNSNLDEGEECDGNDFDGVTCADLGWHHGHLTCNAGCKIRQGSCSGRCGDGRVDPDVEICEPLDMERRGPSCVSQGYDAGQPGCDSTCNGWTTDCLEFGWTQERAVDRDAHMVDIAAAGGSFVALFSSGGVRSDARNWAPVGGQPGAAITGRALWASSLDDIWVIKSDGNGFLHWNGSAWNFVDSWTGGLRDIWGTSSSDIFAVGSGGVIVHFDGDEWRIQQHAMNSSDLVSVWGVGRHQVYAVGTQGALYSYNGSRWSIMDGSGTLANVTSIWVQPILGAPIQEDGRTKVRIWTVSSSAVRRRDDGSQWTLMLDLYDRKDSLTGGRDGDDVAGDGEGPAARISGTGPGDVWVTLRNDGSVRHYDGRRWTTLLAGASGQAQPIAAARDVVIVGDSGDSGQVRRWSGAGNGPLLASSGIWADAWTFDPVPAPAFWADASPPEVDFWIAVGRDPQTGEGLALHSDGHIFRFDDPLHRIVGFGRDRAYAASDRQIFEWDGEAWSVLRSGNGMRVVDLWTSRFGEQADLFAIDQNITTGPGVLRFDGRRWFELPPIEPDCFETQVVLSMGWASGPQDVYVVGPRAVYHLDGSQWHRDLSCDGQYESIWGSARDDVWVSESLADTGQSALHHWNGRDWTYPTSNPRSSIVDGSGRLVGTASDDIFLGSSAYFDGQHWAPIQQSKLAGTPVIALPSRLLTVGAVDGTIGLGQFVRTRFWNRRAAEVHPYAGSDADCSDGVDNDANGASDRGDSRCVPEP
jgi:hypothetical protein